MNRNDTLTSTERSMLLLILRRPGCSTLRCATLLGVADADAIAMKTKLIAVGFIREMPNQAHRVEIFRSLEPNV